MNNGAFNKLVFQTLPVSKMIQQADFFYSSMKMRHSVRDFSGEAIPMEIIEKALLTEGSAPSGANKQPWHFAVVTDTSVKHEIRLAAKEREFYQHRASDAWKADLKPLGTDEQNPFSGIAPCLIAIFLQKFDIDESGNKHKNYYPVESVGIATGILISSLHLSGLATLTHTPSPMKFLNKILKRPKNEKAFLLIVVGFPAKEATVPNITRKSLDQMCSFFCLSD